MSWPHGLKGHRRTPTSPSQGGAMRFWIKGRSLAEHRLLGEARNTKLRRGNAKPQTSISFPDRLLFLF